MNGLAALAAKEAAIASGVGASLLPGIAPSAIDGFAVGTLLSGLCFLMVMTPKRGLRRGRLAARVGLFGSAAPAEPGYAHGVTLSDPFADESAEVVVPLGSPLADEASLDAKAGAHRSKHRLADQDGDRRSEARRLPGRHAAPSVSLTSKMASRFAFHPIAVRD